MPKQARARAKGIEEESPPPGSVSEPRVLTTPASIIFLAGANLPSLRKNEALGDSVATTPVAASPHYS